MAKVAANLTFIEARALTGPGHYAVQLFEHLVAMDIAAALPFALSGYVQEGARHHFSAAANARLTSVGELGGRAGRVAFEQLLLPWRSRRDGVDLLWSPAFVSPLWGAPVLIASICDMYYRVAPEAVEARQLKYWKMMIPLTARVCEAIITISENSKKDIVAHLPVAAERVFVTPLASRMRRGQHAAGPAPVAGGYVLLVANTTRNKNCERVAAAIAMLRARGRVVRLVHIGDDLDDRLRMSSHNAGVADLLVSLGEVDEQVLADAYRHCLATIVASTYEGFGMPAAEAQAMGAPLICSNRSAVPEAAGGIEGGAALFVDPFDVGQIADAIERMMDNDRLRAAMIRRGLEQAARLSWERTARQTAAVFEWALAERRA